MLIVDVSFDLSTDTACRRARLPRLDHLPGAHYLHVDRDPERPPKTEQNSPAIPCPIAPPLP